MGCSGYNVQPCPWVPSLNCLEAVCAAADDLVGNPQSIGRGGGGGTTSFFDRPNSGLSGTIAERGSSAFTPGGKKGPGREGEAPSGSSSGTGSSHDSSASSSRRGGA